MLAMLALASQSVKDKPELRKVLLLGIFGTCLFYGDGVITPAISVLSAVEGMEIVSPHFRKYVIPITLVRLFLLAALVFLALWRIVGSRFGMVLAGIRQNVERESARGRPARRAPRGGRRGAPPRAARYGAGCGTPPTAR